MSKPIWIKWCPKDAIDGMMTLGPWEELAYRRLLDLIYSTGDNLPDDDRKLAWMTKTGSRWKKIKATLIADGKICVLDGRVTNPRCKETLAESERFFEQKAEAGRISAERRNRLRHKETASTDAATTAPTREPSNHNHIEKPSAPYGAKKVSLRPGADAPALQARASPPSQPRTLRELWAEAPAVIADVPVYATPDSGRARVMAATQLFGEQCRAHAGAIIAALAPREVVISIANGPIHILVPPDPEPDPAEPSPAERRQVEDQSHFVADREAVIARAMAG